LTRTPHAPPLHPLGAARQRLDPAPPGAYPAALLAPLEDAGLGPEALYLAWQLGAWATGLTAAERSAFVAVIVRGLCAQAGGSTRLEVDADERRLLGRAPQVVGPPGARTPLVLDGAHLYQQRLLVAEERLADALRARAAAAPLLDEAAAAEAFAAVAATANPRPSAEQAAAVQAALRGRLTVISGGPGTGKTTIALTMVRALVRLGVPLEALALAAPTGKAANRLEEALKAGFARMGALDATDGAIADRCPPAETLHRLLGYSPRTGTFQHHQNNRLAQKVILVDESSMIDLTLMDRLVRAVADDARLVLLGDADQLPSVDAGAVFRDLGPLAIRLTESHRMDPRKGAGRRVLEVANALRAGDEAALRAGIAERARVEDLQREGVELVPAAAREDFLADWYERHVGTPDVLGPAAAVFRIDNGRFSPEDEARLTALLAALSRARLLCVTRGRETGVDATNDWLHRRHTDDGGRFAPGEPVMALRNDYERGLWNGDQGVIVRLASADRAEPPRLAAAFPTRAGWAAWEVDSLQDRIAPAFAMTVHKAQGSEFDVVGLLLPDQPVPLLTRELLYTAVTRTRTSALLCGSPTVLAAGARAALARSTGLGARLARQ
jgi:exodeoxyribonuclease V alpha subunit